MSLWFYFSSADARRIWGEICLVEIK
uniref:Uncharacterized protein n=1 Tax=Rhizophora mucronata TaxID=61149 RepID=A0A2P2PV25_RHIMU